MNGPGGEEANEVSLVRKGARVVIISGFGLACLLLRFLSEGAQQHEHRQLSHRKQRRNKMVTLPLFVKLLLNSVALKGQFCSCLFPCGDH